MRSFLALVSLSLILMACGGSGGSQTPAGDKTKTDQPPTGAPDPSTKKPVANPIPQLPGQPPANPPTTSDVPYITLNGGVDVVQYPMAAGSHLEAWEIVKRAGGTYLNYSRFPYGDLDYKGKPTHVCTAKVGALKFIGVSENPDRLMKAMRLVIESFTDDTAYNSDCRVFSNLLQQYPEFKSLEEYFRAL